MCYYSLSMPRSTFRGAKEGEDLVVSHLEGHGIVRAESDGLVACVAGGTTLHMAEFKLTPQAEKGFLASHPWMQALIGQPITARFTEGHDGAAADGIVVNGPHRIAVRLHLQYIPSGTKLYTGPLRPDIADTLGVTDPSIALDHMHNDPLVVHQRDLAKV